MNIKNFPSSNSYKNCTGPSNQEFIKPDGLHSQPEKKIENKPQKNSLESIRNKISTWFNKRSKLSKTLLKLTFAPLKFVGKIVGDTIKGLGTGFKKISGSDSFALVAAFFLFPPIYTVIGLGKGVFNATKEFAQDLKDVKNYWVKV